MSINILDEMKNDFLVYAQEVNQNRSFPDACDGLKPSQRACLWEMYDKGYSSNKPHIKSAKVDGGVIANWWPHGSEYSTIVRMSQPWINNICEVDFHGANGSLQGGGEAAAPRYTECRLSKAAEDGFFESIKKDSVDFIKNYSEDQEWPYVFPAIFPRLMINGSQGIGYTLAQEWEPTNLNEFVEQVKAYLKNGKVDCTAIYPDYPTGGVIINKKDIHTIYETGRGSIILRAKTEVEGNVIKITELPYQVYAEPLIQKIKDLVNDGQITGIEDIYNKSDDNGLLIEIECSDDTNIILSRLFKLTDMQVSFNANMMALVENIPQMLTLKDYIKIYVNHNICCIKREYIFDKAKAEARLEIVNGLVQALENIDNIISLIKKSKSSADAVISLKRKYKFTDIQAKAIVDMKLGKLANLETIELNKEQEDLTKTISNCNEMLKSEAKQNKEFLSRLQEFAKKYGWERRTSLTDIDIVKEKKAAKERHKSTEQFMVVLTKGNTIKRIKLADYRPQGKVRNEEDKIIAEVKVGAKDKVILISENGVMYKLVTNKISLGSMTSSGTVLGDKMIAMFDGTEDKPYIFMVTDRGRVKKMTTSTVFSVGKNIGTTVMRVNDEKVIHCILATDDDAVIVNNGKKDYIIHVKEFTPRGRNSGGVNGIKSKNRCIIKE